MRKYLLLLIVFSCSLYGTVIAQISNQPEQNCPGAISVCHGDYTQTTSYSGSGTINELTTVFCPGGNNGALGAGEKNGVWYQVNVVCNGFLSFTIMPLVGTEDYDWACWNITGGGCSLIYNYTTNTPNYYPPYGGTCGPPANNGASNFAPNLGIGGWTGLTQNPTLLLNGQFNPSFPVTAGQTFAILVSNYSSSVHGYTISFDSSTACLHDTIPPKFTSAVAKCGYTADNIEVTMSVPVECSTLDPNGSDFYLTAATGTAPPTQTVIAASSSLCISAISATTSYNVKFSSALAPGAYWLHSKVGNDTNTLIDYCTNHQLITDSIEFTMTPPAPPVIVGLDTPACNRARVVFNRGVKCSTVDVDGSDFLINDAFGDTIKISRALAVSCNDIGLVDTVDLFYTASILKPGLYQLSIVTGHDGDAITDTCGQVVPTVFPFYVSDGGVTATATPNLLCAPGYFNLGAGTAMLPPPPLVTNCGANGTVCTGGTGYQAGNGTDSMSAAHTLFGGSKTQRRTRMLFNASELTALGVGAGTFSQLAFNVTTKNSTLPFQNFTIKMGCTADSLIDTSQNFPASFSPALEIVYGPKAYSTTLGWNYLQLDNTYDWSATQNLLVEICYSDTSLNGNDIVQGTLVPYQSFSAYSSNQTVQGCALSSSIGEFDTVRPNMQFVFCPQDTTPKFNWVWTPSHYLYNGLVDSTTAYAFQTTTYTATIIDKDYCYRRDTALLTISVRHPWLGPLDTSLCIGNSVYLNATGGVSYAWYPNKGLSCDTCDFTLVTIDSTTTYFVRVGDQYKCADTLQATVTINYLPVISVSPKDTMVLYQVPVQIFAFSPGARYYTWQPATGLDNPDAPNPFATPDTNTAYIVTVIDTNSCSNTDTVTVRIYERGVEIPTAFTPNGDGKNDVFHVANLTSQKIAEFRVFNRWGQQVFDGANSNKGWDGTYNGVEQGIGSYNYLIRVAFHDGSLKTYSGSVTLIR